MCCESIRDQDTIWTQANNSTVQMMSAFEQISHSITQRPGMAVMGEIVAMAAMATLAPMVAMAAMAAMATVLSSMDIWDDGN